MADGDTILLLLYQAFLIGEDIEVRTASTGLECLEQLRRWRPDVLVLDAELLWGAGAGVLSVRGEEPTLPVVPVLLLAADPAAATEEAVPIRDYALLIKPVPPTVLVGVIRTLADAGWGSRPRRAAVSAFPGPPSVEDAAKE
jgi:DNA-binding NtrC family response regulator